MLPGVALAQVNMCRLPGDLRVETAMRPAGEEARTRPIARYTLALSWSPGYCKTHPDDGQCDRSIGRFGFILHGLWPESAGRDYPQWCAPSPAPLTPAIVRDQFCTTPTARLIAHEWAKHGTCMTRDPAAYFATGRKLFAQVKYPDMAALSRRRIDVGGFKRLMSQANPRIRPSALSVSTDRDGGWLREVQVCLSKTFVPEPCPRGSGGAPDGAPLKIWRGDSGN